MPEITLSNEELEILSDCILSAIQNIVKVRQTSSSEKLSNEMLNDTRIKTHKLLKEIGIPVSVFCRKIGISQTAYYRWQTGDLRLSDEKETRIRQYVNKLSELSCM